MPFARLLVHVYNFRVVTMAPTQKNGHAGIFAGKRRELSADGFEMTWAVNVLAPFLLTALLADAVTGRVVNVSSISAGRDLDWGNLNQVSGALTKECGVVGMSRRERSLVLASVKCTSMVSCCCFFVATQHPTCPHSAS